MTEESYRRCLSAGERLFVEGEAGHCAYVVESGRLEVLIERGGERERVATVGPGALLGEMALIDDRPRSATIVAVEPAQLTVVTREYLRDRLETADPLLRHILRMLIQRMREMLGVPPLDPRWSAAHIETDEDEAEDRERAYSRLHTQHDLERALERGEFTLYFQPIVRLSDSRAAGFEALIRWLRPDGKPVPPAEFIPLAEESAFINRLGRWTLDAGCAALRTLQSGPGADVSLFMSVNLSGRQLHDAGFLPALEAALQRSAIAPACLRLEVTETLFVADLDAASEFLRRCRALGVKLSMDDFGTGYSSLSYLHKLPVQSVKLDRVFIQDLLESDSGSTIVAAIARLARDLGMETVAEGVETAAQAQALRRLGVTYVQGYFCARPMPAREATLFLERTAQAGALEASIA